MSLASKVFSVLIIALLISGFGPSSARQGRKYLEKGDYTKALEALTDAVNKNPDDHEVHRDLGIAYYKVDQYEQALKELGKAEEGLKKDSEVIFYLGLTYERLKQYDKAIEEYTNYTRLGRFSRMKKKIQERAQMLIQKQAAQWAEERMKVEDEIDSAAIPDNTIAVTYFKPFNVSEELEPLHKGLTDLLIVDLSMVESLQVVERIKLREIYNELGLASTEVIDQSTAPNMGKLLGANTLVTGTFTGLEKEVWRIDPTLGHVKVSEFQALESVEGQFQKFLQVEKNLVLEVLDSIGVELTQAEREAIMSNIPTDSLQAFLAYSRGLDYLDKGMYSEAASEFGTATSIDPKFDQAKEAKLLSKPLDSPDTLEDSWDSTIAAQKLKNGLLGATVQSVSQGDINRGQVEPEPGPEPDVQVEVLITW